MKNKTFLLIEMCPLLFLNFQVKHYERRLANSDKLSETIFLTGTLEGLKKLLPIYYN